MLDPSLVTAGPPRVVHSPQIAYRIDYSTNEGRSWKILEDDTRFTRFGEGRPYADDDDLAYDETRHYRVFAVGRDSYTDVGPSSTPLSFGITTVSTAPKKPTGVMASAPSLRSIQASWTAPEDNGGKPIVKYYYQYIPDDGDEVADAGDWVLDDNTNFDGTDIPEGTTDDASTSGTLSIPTTKDPLDPDTLYVFRVAAVNKKRRTGSAGRNRRRRRLV